MTPDSIRGNPGAAPCCRAAPGIALRAQPGLRVQAFFDRQDFMNALRSAPFLPVACLAQRRILSCCEIRTGFAAPVPVDAGEAASLLVAATAFVALGLVAVSSAYTAVDANQPSSA